MMIERRLGDRISRINSQYYKAIAQEGVIPSTHQQLVTVAHRHSEIANELSKHLTLPIHQPFGDRSDLVIAIDASARSLFDIQLLTQQLKY